MTEAPGDPVVAFARSLRDHGAIATAPPDAAPEIVTVVEALRMRDSLDRSAPVDYPSYGIVKNLIVLEALSPPSPVHSDAVNQLPRVAQPENISPSNASTQTPEPLRIDPVPIGPKPNP